MVAFALDLSCRSISTAGQSENQRLGGVESAAAKLLRGEIHKGWCYCFLRSATLFLVSFLSYDFRRTSTHLCPPISCPTRVILSRLGQLNRGALISRKDGDELQ